MSEAACVSVVSEEPISCGTHLGPLPLSSTSPDSLALLTWRCVDQLPASKHIIRVSIKDSLNSKGKAPSWLSHILPARNPEEQSLEIVVKGGQLYFRSLREIGCGEELKAWFGQDLADILKLPMISPIIVDGSKRYECMLCQEQFENPFPVVAHLMYRCRRKDPLIPTPMPPFRKKNGGGRVKNFDIATLTDMNTSSERSSSPIITVTSDVEQPSDEGSSSPRKRKVDPEEGALSTKKPRQEVVKEPSPCSSPKKSPLNGAFKMTSSPTFPSGLYSDLNPSDGSNGSSAFKKVDKSSSSFHSNNMTSLSNLFTGSLDPREILFQAAGPNNFTPFPYAFTPVTTSPTYGGVHLSQNGMPPAGHPSISVPTVDTSLTTSAFVPSNGKMTTTPSGSNVHLKMAEDMKMMRKIPDGNYDLGSLMSPTRLPLHYASPKPPSVEVFGAAKAMPGPLLPFLPPSLAALSFPSQNWCAKCNASFRMTSDLVYHMRSHHKRETDPQKLKREEKLRCHICNESFRERHHLTRHMTSHQ